MVISGSVLAGMLLAAAARHMLSGRTDDTPMVAQNTSEAVHETTDNPNKVTDQSHSNNGTSTTANSASSTAPPAQTTSLADAATADIADVTEATERASMSTEVSLTADSPGDADTTSSVADTAAVPSDNAPPAAHMSWADLNELIEPSVVKINVTSSLGRSNGSGFVADAAGLIVTNYHVIEGATEATLAFANGDRISVTGYAYLDPKRDLAVLVFDPSQSSTTLRALPLCSSQPRKGEEVAAFGAPYGLDFTFTQSSVSAIRSADELKEMIGLQNGEGTWIQHSAPISPGNSGGPLVNQNGEVVAINTLTLTVGQNLNFAISSADIQDALSRKLPTALPVVAASAPVIDRGHRSSGPGGSSPFESGRKNAVDLTGDERGAKLMAEMKEVSILILAFTLDRSGTVTGAVRRGAREAVERAKLKVSSFGRKNNVLLIAMELEPNGSTSYLRVTSTLLTLDQSNGDLLMLWEETDDVGTISSQSLMLGRLPPNLRRDIANYFGSLRSAMAKARKAHASKD